LKLFFNQAFSQSCAFLRNIIVARIISPADFGIAAIFSMTFLLLEMISNLAADTLLVQAPDGNELEFQKTAQALHAFRGIINAGILFVLANPISRLFGVPQARWAFHCLALLPLLKAFNHLDLNRLQRDLKFGPQIMADSGSSLLVTIAVLPFGLWLHDYSLMLCLLLLQVTSFLVLSHLSAERTYRWGWDRRYAKRILAFGWPLLINGLLMYVIFQGDRFVIGTSKRLFSHGNYTLGDLGVYSVAFALTMAPAMLVSNVGASLILPLLSRAQGATDQFLRRYVASAEAISVTATMVSIPFIVTGGRIVTLVYGTKYAAAASFIGWLGAMWALRTLRTIPTMGAMALGDTRNSMISNVARTVALPAVLFVAASGASLTWVSICGFLGELLALMICVGRLDREHAVHAKTVFKPFAIAALGMLAAAGAAVAGVSMRSWAIGASASAGLMVVIFAFALIVLPQLRIDLQLLVQQNIAGPSLLEATSAAGEFDPLSIRT
jgi:O-antigen/teichoic acid export membrane protein